MARRPSSLTIVGVLFLVVGCSSIARTAARLARDGTARDGDALDLAVAATSALLAIAGGAAVLRGRAWARWLCAAWLAAHVAVGYLHGWTQLAVHAALFGAISFLLFRPAATAYFRTTA